MKGVDVNKIVHQSHENGDFFFHQPLITGLMSRNLKD